MNNTNKKYNTLTINEAIEFVSMTIEEISNTIEYITCNEIHLDIGNGSKTSLNIKENYLDLAFIRDDGNPTIVARNYLNDMSMEEVFVNVVKDVTDIYFNTKNGG